MHEGVAVTGPQDPPAEAPEDSLTEELPEAAARPEVLVVDDIELRPRWYEEQVDGEGLVIETIVEVEAEARRRLHALFGGAGYFPVVRRGLSDAPDDTAHLFALIAPGKWAAHAVVRASDETALQEAERAMWAVDVG